MGVELTVTTKNPPSVDLSETCAFTETPAMIDAIMDAARTVAAKEIGDALKHDPPTLSLVGGEEDPDRIGLSLFALGEKAYGWSVTFTALVEDLFEEIDAYDGPEHRKPMLRSLSATLKAVAEKIDARL